jgi:ribosomal protein L11 methyltransferase
MELAVQVSEQGKEAASAVLWALGAQGVQEDHPGLHFPDDSGPLIERGIWELPEIVNPADTVLLQAFFEDVDDPDGLKAEAGARLSEQGELAPVTSRAIEDQDWSAAWKARWKAQALTDRLLVVPSWEPMPTLTDGQSAIVMDPGMAFGTGTHATTRGCLVLAEDWLTGGERVLDVGTGTGILAFGALLLGAGSAVGVDTEHPAVVAAHDNAALNGLADRFEARRGSVDAVDGTWDLVFGNLLGPLLVRLAPALSARVAEGGTLIVSGLLVRQRTAVVDAFAPCGLSVVADRVEDGWVALRLERA